MGIALIHIDLTAGPVGIWRAYGDELQAYYPDEFIDRRARAQATMDHKGQMVDWTGWFHQLGDRVPYFVDYQVIDIADDADLATVLNTCREQWSRTDR